ncbi:hypothetical protein OsJ_19949 [Oryza sativa Japonica Group]|nr:hypothetical protein OsJ_19949 [Oryza sativa Japonica Group]
MGSGALAMAACDVAMRQQFRCRRLLGRGGGQDRQPLRGRRRRRRKRWDLAAGDVNGETAEVVEHAALGEVPERRVGAQGNVAHVNDAVGDEGHGTVERHQGEQHECDLRGASSSTAGQRRRGAGSTIVGGVDGSAGRSGRRGPPRAAPRMRIWSSQAWGRRSSPSCVKKLAGVGEEELAGRGTGVRWRCPRLQMAREKRN